MSQENPGASTDYSPNPWMQNQPPEVRLKKPNYQSLDDEVRVQDLISNLTQPSDEIRGIRPRVGLPPFTPRFGYEQHQPTIYDVMSMGPNVLMQDTATKQESGIQSSIGPSLGKW